MGRINWRNAHCMGSIVDGDETSKTFGRSCRGNISPLYWRIPILLWSVVIITWSVCFFWGSREKFFIYMTHWGLMIISLESLFGIIVTVRKTRQEKSVYASFVIMIIQCLKSLKLQCEWRMVTLEHPLPSEFHLSKWLNSRSSLPLLLLRSFLFLLSASVLIISMILTNITFNIHIHFWFIYWTHWIFLVIVLSSAFSSIVSAYAYFINPIDATFGLPWYVKTYWVLYNIAIPVSFLVSGFYWGLLRSKAGNMDYFTPNPVLDVMLHGINSAVMLVELISSAHPSRLLHIMQPLMFAGVYLLFTVIYFYAGGHDPWGHEYIYPVMDWNKPRETIVVAALSGLFLALMHIVVVAISTLRDVIARRFLRDVNGVYNNAFSA